jgi:hypothetical protein
MVMACPVPVLRVHRRSMGAALTQTKLYSLRKNTELPRDLDRAFDRRTMSETAFGEKTYVAVRAMRFEPTTSSLGTKEIRDTELAGSSRISSS